MTIHPVGSLATLTLFTLFAGCYGDSARRFPTGIVTPGDPPPPAAPVIHFRRRGYPNAWEAVGLVGTTLRENPFSVSTDDGKSTLSGLEIVWAVDGDGGSVTPTQDVTRDGLSEATLSLGPNEGAYTVTATAPTLPGAPQVTFKATGVTLMVDVRDLVDGGFVPADVTIPAGRSVGWRYASGEEDAHNVVFEDDPTRPVSSGDMWDLWAGSRYHSRLFTGSPRTIRYRCTYHSTGFVSGEAGTVTVK